MLICIALFLFYVEGHTAQLVFRLTARNISLTDCQTGELANWRRDTAAPYVIHVYHLDTIYPPPLY